MTTNASAQRERETERASGFAGASEGRAYKINKKLLEEMLAAAVHFGHKVSKWNPKMREYIYTKREGVHIFDLTKTYESLMRALNFLTEKASEGKTILIVSTKLQATKLVAEAALKTGCPSVTQKWMPGLLTNFETIRRRIKYFRDLKQAKDSGEWDKYTKRERLDLSRALKKLEDAFSGVENMLRLPDAVVVFDAIHDELVLREAKRLKIPTIGICDSNADPDLLAFPIPGNDDAIKSLKFFVDQVTNAILEGKKIFEGRTPVSAAVTSKPNPALSQAVAPVV